MDLFTLRVRMRNIKRIREIVNALALHGFGYIIESSGFGWLIKLGGHIKGLSRIKIQERRPMAERLRMTIEELGPTFIKFGQLLSSRPDILPKDVIREFSKLLDETPPLPFEELENTLKRELGNDYEKRFEYIDKRAYKSASLAQVHRAQLKGGREVVLKILRPGIREQVKQDLEILSYIAERMTRRVPDTRVYNPIGIVRELKKAINRELNFYMEAANTDRMRDFLSDLEYIVIPEVIWELTTTQVLTLEYIEGKSLREIIEEGVNEADGQVIAERLVNAVLKMIFEEGFFHSDPHPGNILVLDDNKIAILDCGQVGIISDSTKDLFSRIMFAIVNREASGIAREMRKFWIITDEEKLDGLEEDIEYLVNRFYGLPLKHINISDLIDEMSDVAREHALKSPRDLILLAKVIAILESEAREIDPEFNVINLTKPFAKKIMMEQISPQRLLKRGQNFITNTLDLLNELPEQLYFILKKVRRGTLKMEFEHKGIDKHILSLNRSLSHLSISMILTGILIGSSLMISAETRPLVYGVSVFGILGYIISAIMGLWMVFSLIRGREW